LSIQELASFFFFPALAVDNKRFQPSSQANGVHQQQDRQLDSGRQQDVEAVAGAAGGSSGVVLMPSQSEIESKYSGYTDD
jgi:hypothetical protein